MNELIRPLTNAELNRRHKARYPEKAAARRLAHNALRRGVIPPPPTVCPKCGETPRTRKDGRRSMEMHHHKGYEHPLEVAWICWLCHRAEQRGTRQPTVYIRQVVLKTHCKNGHEFTPENTWVSHGRRNCRGCHRLYASRKREAAKGATNV